MKDLDSNPISSTDIVMERDSEAFFAFIVDCFAGFALSASFEGDVQIYAKAEIGDLFTNISSGSLDLSPYAGELKTIYFRVNVDADADKALYVLQIQSAIA